MAGYVASNVRSGEVSVFHYYEVADLLGKREIIVDVREPKERENRSIEGSINIPFGELRDRLNELPNDRLIHVHCQVGLRGYLTTRILTQSGYRAKNLSGGYKTYESAVQV